MMTSHWLINPCSIRILLLLTAYTIRRDKDGKRSKRSSVKLAVGGKGMLLWQGAASYKLYTGLEMPTDEYQKFQAENEGNKKNEPDR